MVDLNIKLAPEDSPAENGEEVSKEISEETPETSTETEGTDDNSEKEEKELSAREQAYAKYAQTEGLASSDEEESEEVAKADVPHEEKEEKEKKSKVAVKEQSDEKTVPLGALKEERDKRKALQTEVRSLKAQINANIEKQQKAIKASTEKKETEGEEIEDYDSELLALREQIAELKKKISDREEVDEHNAASKRIEDVNVKASNVNQELEKEGFPGFSANKPLVIAHLNQLAQEDPNFSAISRGVLLHELDNPAGWKKIYKEVIFPDMQKAVLGNDKDELIAAKKKLKKQAQLSGNSGGKPQPKSEKEEKWTNNDYIKLRRSG